MMPNLAKMPQTLEIHPIPNILSSQLNAKKKRLYEKDLEKHNRCRLLK